MDITNRSIADETQRQAIRAHLLWLASKLDDDVLNHQLLTLKYELLAASDELLEQDLKTRGESIHANKISVARDD